MKHAIKNADGNISKDLWVIKDMDLEVKEGESVGIIGPNGSGKSTLLKILAGITKPTTGIIELYGKLGSILDVGAGFHPEISGRENILIKGQLMGSNRKEIKNKMDEIIHFSGIENFIDEPVKSYSNGMYLRLAFSTLIHLDADIYLFDEVLSVGDQEFRNKCFLKIKEKILEGKTIITVSHERTFLSLITNRIIKFPEIEDIQTNTDLEYNKSALAFDPNSITLKRAESMYTDKNIQFMIELNGKVPEKDIAMALFFRSIENNVGVFSICSLHPAEPIHVEINPDTETLKFEATIPAYLINKGKYSISIKLILNKKYIFKEFDDSFVLDVEADPEFSDLFYNNYPGPIRLKANWEINS